MAKAAATQTETYVCEFERIGRDRSVGTREFKVASADDLAEQVYRLARTKVASRDVEVVVTLPEGDTPGHGNIFCGVHSGGSFTVKAKES